MGKFDDLVAKYHADSKKLRLGLSEDLIRKVAKGCGPSIYSKDASKVSGTDPAELARVKKNYLMKKLGLKDDPKLDKALSAAMEKMGKGNRNKWRVLVYAQLCKKFKKESVYK
ncbi:MAG: DUF2853 family protein [Saprospiraceae bacterium]|nr:DUF2853 family protein [Saprospiraceae bacterium]